MAKQRLNPETLNRPAAYTQVVTAEGGRLVFLAGQTPINLQGEVVGAGDLRAQARQVYENISKALAAAGASYADVVKMTAYVVNYNQEARGVIGEVRREFVGEADLPAHTLLGIQSLARPEFLIEVDTIAVVDHRAGRNIPPAAKRLIAGAGIALVIATVARRIRHLLSRG